MTVREATAVFGCCALPRLAWLCFAPAPFRSDWVVLADAWRGIAVEGSRETWVRGLEPLYPLFLALFGSTVARQVAQVVFVSAGGV